MSATRRGPPCVRLTAARRRGAPLPPRPHGAPLPWGVGELGVGGDVRRARIPVHRPGAAVGSGGGLGCVCRSLRLSKRLPACLSVRVMSETVGLDARPGRRPQSASPSLSGGIGPSDESRVCSLKRFKRSKSRPILFSVQLCILEAKNRDSGPPGHGRHPAPGHTGPSESQAVRHSR